jgi:hypothetical protein
MFLEDKLIEIGMAADISNSDDCLEKATAMINARLDDFSSKPIKINADATATLNRLNNTFIKASAKLAESGKDFVKPSAFRIVMEQRILDAGLQIAF